MGIFALTESMKEKSISATAIPVDKRSGTAFEQYNMVIKFEIVSCKKLSANTIAKYYFSYK